MARLHPTVLVLAAASLAAGGCHRPRPAAPAPPAPRAAPLPPPPPAAPPAITLAPAAGTAGTPVTVAGQGFPPETAVTVHVGPPQSEASEEPYARGVADAKGALTVTFPMPPLALPGAGGASRTVVVLATTPGYREKATAEFAYAPGPAPPPTPRASPSPPLHPLARKPTPAEERAVRAVVMRHLEGLPLMQGVTAEVEAVIGRHARALAKPPEGRTDIAYVFVEKGRRGWSVVAGPGTSFEDEELMERGIPPGLWPTPSRLLKKALP